MSTHKRKCHFCNAIDDYESTFGDGVKCHSCGNFDTRPHRPRTRSKYVTNHCLGYLDLPVEQIESIYESRHDMTKEKLVEIVGKICMSHERLRAEVAGRDQSSDDANYAQGRAKEGGMS